MAEIVFTGSVNAGKQDLGTITPVDVDGNPATVDAAGFVKESIDGDGDVILDPRGSTLDVIVKPGTVGTTTTVKGYIDADLGEGVKRIDISFVTTTIAAEATGANLVSRGTETLGAEVTPPVEG